MIHWGKAKPPQKVTSANATNSKYLPNIHVTIPDLVFVQDTPLVRMLIFSGHDAL